jgi:hypothetical protein
MASMEQIQVLLAQQQAQFIHILNGVMEKMHQKPVENPEGRKPLYLDERKFRETGKFEGDENKWKEFALKFSAVVKEVDADIFDMMKWASEQDDEITDSDISDQSIEGEGLKYSTMIYNRVMHHLTGAALSVHQSVEGENGFEVWRRLSKRYNPMTPMRGFQLMLKIMLPGKIKKGQDIQQQVNKWEGWISTIERDYEQKFTPMMKVGLLITMLPEELQDTVLQHADRLKDYKLVKDKVLNLVDAKARLKDPNAMDVGYAGFQEDEERWFDEGEYDEADAKELGALGESATCYRCGGHGHMARDCATPKGKGKGKDSGTKGYGKGVPWQWQSKGGKGKDGKGKGNGKGKGKGAPCSHCGKTGHGPDKCWTLHPEQLPWSGANAVEYDHHHQTLGGFDVCVGGFDIGLLECVYPAIEAPPGLRVKVKNRFDALREEDGLAEVKLDALDVIIPMKGVYAVKAGGEETLVPAGKGWITVDSGAAESVMPTNVVVNEELIEGEAKKSGVKYVAANGGKMDNYGEKRVRFKRKGAECINTILFQVTDVGKPLAAVSKILDKGNTVVFSRKACGSFITNDVTGERITLEERQGTFGLEVEYYEPAAMTTGFTRPGSM